MIRTPVQSSNVNSIGWDDGALEVEFSTGAVYQYKKVPEDVFKSLVAARSVGRYLAVHVKPNYEYEQVTEDAATDGVDVVVCPSLEEIPRKDPSGNALVAVGHIDGAVELHSPDGGYKVIVVAKWLADRLGAVGAASREADTAPIRVVVPRSPF